MVISYKKIPEVDCGEQLKAVKECIEKVKNKNIWEDIVESKFKGKFAVVDYLIGLGEQGEDPVVSNCFFIKNSKLWYFFGTSKGRVLGLPAIAKDNEQIIVCNSEDEVNSPVAYMSSIENLLLISWQNGMFNIYTTDNLEYTIQTSLSAL